MPKHHYLDLLYQEIAKKDLIHKKMLDSLWKKTTKDIYFEEANSYLELYINYLTNDGVSLEYIVDSYLNMCKSILIEQIKFKRTGRYSYDSFEETNEKVYSDKEFMKQYMIGVAVSQALWRNHYEMFKFFSEEIADIERPYGYLEIGVGHGSFLHKVIQNGKFEKLTVVDVSQASLELTQGLLMHAGFEICNIDFINQDIMTSDLVEGQKYDFITMGEVLEHVESPLELLEKIHDLLSTTGKAYISTCANAPVIDHIYLFNTIDEIRLLIEKSGLCIDKEIVIPNDNTSEENWVKDKANLSYACILKH
jgi:2-polyprenyl-3-methyl-5-hydroxy-6-metoxy-1,4-benzoquinol methylase